MSFSVVLGLFGYVCGCECALWFKGDVLACFVVMIVCCGVERVLEYLACVLRFWGWAFVRRVYVYLVDGSCAYLFDVGFGGMWCLCLCSLW